MRLTFYSIFLITTAASAQYLPLSGGTMSGPLSYGAKWFDTRSDGMAWNGTTGNFSAGSTSGTVGTCINFSAGNSVYIAGAGTGGTAYNGTIVSCSGITLTVSPAVSTTVSSATVGTDDTTAMAAIASSNAPASRIILPVGTSIVTPGPLAEWAPSTSYPRGQYFAYGGAIYLVVTAYTSGASFGSLDISNTTAAPWAASTSYLPGQYFSYAGVVYVVITAYTSGASFGSLDTSNTTPAPQTNGAIQLPKTSEYFTMCGQGPDYATMFQDSGANLSSAPVFSFGGPGSIVAAGMNLCDFQIKGAIGESYPSGMLTWEDFNLNTVERVELKQYDTSSAPANWSVGISDSNSGTDAFFQEMHFDVLRLYGPQYGTNTTGIQFSPPYGNTNFIDSNVEQWTTGVKFLGSDGTPVLTWVGGHIERVPPSGLNPHQAGGWAMYIDQAEPHVYGLDASGASNFFLGSGVVGGELTIHQSQRAYYSYIVDNGIGNRYTMTSPQNSDGENVQMQGDEYYKTANNIVPDPLFIKSGVGSWSCTNASAAVQAINAPGTKAGRSLLITPTSSGGYCQQSFSVTSSTDYILTGIFYFDTVYTAAQIQVYDQSNNLIWDSGSFSGANATPTISSSNTYRVMRQWIPASGTVTSLTVRVISPNDTPVQFMGLLVNPSTITMGSATPTGTASCSGTGVGYACTVYGENSGASASGVSWSPSAPTYQSGAFLRFHIVTSSTNVQVALKYGPSSSQFKYLMLMPGINNDIQIAVASVPQYISLSDYYGPTSAQMTISQMSIVPWYTNTVIPVTVYNDGNVVEGITPDGVQQRGVPSSNSYTQLANGYCVSVATASSTLWLYRMGNNFTSSCTDTAYNTGNVAVQPRAYTVTDLQCVAQTGGVNSSSGAVTLVANNSATIGSCTFGTGTTCSLHGLSYNGSQGDSLGIKFTTQASETLGVISCAVAGTYH